MDAKGASSSKPPWNYHVFLSFRGEDTRKNFTDHLYTALWKKGIITYRDDEELERGQVIKQELQVAIEESLCAIVILSPNYASSTWCLDELLKILESKKKFGIEVFPIFYGVDPSDVRKQRRSFAKAFAKHEENLKENPDKVQKWRDALEEVGNLSGWDTKNLHEAELIEEIAAKVWTTLQPDMPSDDYEGLVGIDSKVKDICSHLRLELDHDVRFIGIWGMGGIGKTTLAEVVFNKIKTQFDIHCFLANIREVSGERGHGLLQLQGQLLSPISLKSMKIESLDHGRGTIRNLLYRRKVLLVLDDVSDASQLKNLAGDISWFGPGTRVVVTTRNEHLLTAHKITVKYKIDLLNHDEALQLLCQKAFKADHPPECYSKLSAIVVQYAGGLPLVHEVLGSYLCGRNESQWKESLCKIEQVPENDNWRKVLKVSYDELPKSCKTLFLDVACFFNGQAKDEVIQILQNCDRYPPIGIDILVEKSLVTCVESQLRMHDLLQELGRKIVIERSPFDASKRSRFWSLEDIDQVLRTNKGSDLIEGISLESSKEMYVAHWQSGAFSKMSNLKLLRILCPLQLLHGLRCLPNSLKVLQWRGYSLNNLPTEQLDEIVDMKMHHSKIKQLWKETQFFGKLKSIDLRYSEDLIQTQNVFEIPRLEKLILAYCIKVVELHQSIGQHKNLKVLDLQGCINLKSLPSKLEMNNLEEFILSGCSKIKQLPEFGKNMKSLKILKIEGCFKVSQLPCNIGQNVTLEELDMSGTAIREITSYNICFENLKRLSVGRCKEPLPNSWDLSLPIGRVGTFWMQLVSEASNPGGYGLTLLSDFFYKFMKHPVPVSFSLPPLSRFSSSQYLNPGGYGLTLLSDFFCKFMKHPVPVSFALPPLSRFSSLQYLDLSYLNLSDGSIPDDLGCLRNLRSLYLMGNNFSTLPTHCIAKLSELDILSLDRCAMLQSLPVLPPNLRWLYATNCARLETLSDQMLWKFMVRMMEGPDRFDLYIPMGQIPLWFENENYVYRVNPSIGYHASRVIVDLPHHCRSSEWWGIALCFALEPAGSFVEESSTLVDCTPLEGLDYTWFVTIYSDPYLKIVFRSSNDKNTQGRNQLSFLFFEFAGPKIREARSRVLCKEDVEAYRREAMSDVDMLFNLNEYSRSSTVTLTEIANDEQIPDEDMKSMVLAGIYC